MKKNNHVNYSDKDIQSLTEIEGVRFRPTMYIKDIGLYAVMHLLKESLNNSIDEFIGGFGKTIYVHIDNLTDKRGPRFTIEDFGRGIPHGKLVDSVSKLHTSGKYGDIANKGGLSYSISGGINGTGSKIINFLSRDFVAVSNRDGESWKVEYDKGISKGSIIKTKHTGPSGTLISYTPDVTVLGEVDVSNMKKEYQTYVEMLSYIVPGVTIEFKWDNERPIKFYNPNGTTDYFNKLVKDKHIRLIGKYNHIKYKSSDDTGYDIVYGFASKGSGFVSYVNGIHTVEGGVHVTALSEAMGVLTSALNKGGYIPKSNVNKYKISGNEIKDSIFAIVLADYPHPKFETQVKSKFSSLEYRPKVVTQMKKDISNWINNNRKIIDKIGAHCALVAKARYESGINRNKILKSGSTKNELFKDIDIKKFSDCNKSDPSKTELFLCEGDSAATGAKSGRDRDYQAVFALRGKLKNTVKSNDLSDELKTLVKIMGCGKDDTFDINKLRYSKIIILTDADVDGFHISSLLAAFFYRYYIELIEAGVIHIAKPPLYTVKVKGKENLYINNQEELRELLVRRSMNIFSVIDSKGNKVPKGVAKYYMMHLPEYASMIDQYAEKLVVDPLLLEAIAINFNDLAKGKFKAMKHYGFEVTNFIDLGDIKKIDFDRGYEHYSIQLDKMFIKTIINPILDFIKSKIKLCRLRLLGNNTGLKYSGFYYNQGKLIYNSLFNAKGFQIHRDKGLGSMNYVDLRETSMDPASRYIIRLDIVDRAEADKWMRDLFLNSDAKRDMFTIE